MSKTTGASSLTGSRSNFPRHDVAHSTQAKFALLHFSFHLLAVLWPRAFGHDNQRAEIASGITRSNGIRHFFEIEGNFGDQNDIGTSSQSSMKRNPAGVTPHHSTTIARLWLVAVV